MRRQAGGQITPHHQRVKKNCSRYSLDSWSFPVRPVLCAVAWLLSLLSLSQTLSCPPVLFLSPMCAPFSSMFSTLSHVPAVRTIYNIAGGSIFPFSGLILSHMHTVTTFLCACLVFLPRRHSQLATWLRVAWGNLGPCLLTTNSQRT
jgi:hypothetical protein